MKKLVAIALALFLTACSSNSDTVEITVGGSTSIQGVMEKLAESYTEADVSVQGGGSSVGVQGVNEGTFEIGMVSRELKDSETSIEETVIAFDGIAVIVNNNNSAKDLTMSQVVDIFTGKITNWNELGGEDKEIAVVSREESSGTRGAFEEIVGYKSDELIANANIQKSTGGVIQEVAGNENAIGFISLGSLDSSVHAVAIDGVVASEANVKAKTYSIFRPFLVVTKTGSVDAEAQAFIDYITSAAGQKIISESGFITID